MTMARWYPDELDGFEHTRLALPSEGDGELVATLVRRVRERLPSEPQAAVLYVHGYVDYFFQTHLAEAFSNAGFDFYALDLRRSGRSLRPGNVPHQCTVVDDYFAELDWAISVCTASGLPLSGVVGHSTGGLVTALYAHRGAKKNAVGSLALNSPFFAFRANSIERLALRPLVGLGARFPVSTLPALARFHPIYGQTLHTTFGGEWSYDLGKKPIEGFGVTAGWIRAVALAHAEVQAGLDIACPVLVLHSSGSRVPGSRITEADRSHDIVLDVAHMKEFGPSLGARVEVRAIAGGVHDLVLSRPAVREEALRALVRFVEKNGS